MEFNRIKESINIIEQALNLAAKQGVFNLKDSTTIQVALNTVGEFVEINTGLSDSTPKLKSGSDKEIIESVKNIEEGKKVTK